MAQRLLWRLPFLSNISGVPSRKACTISESSSDTFRKRIVSSVWAVSHRIPLTRGRICVGVSAFALFLSPLPV